MLRYATGIGHERNIKMNMYPIAITDDCDFLQNRIILDPAITLRTPYSESAFYLPIQYLMSKHRKQFP